jgi:hypothetical protein
VQRGSKTLLIAVPYIIGGEMVINQEAIEYLVDRGLNVIVLAEEQRLFKAGLNTYLLKKYLRGKPEITLGVLRNLFFADTVRLHSETMELKLRSFDQRNKIQGFARKHIGRRLGKWETTKKALSWADANLFPDRFYGGFFDTTKPDAVFVVQPFLYDLYPVLRRARKKGIPIIAYVPSWDNLTSKWEIPTTIDKLVVWNQGMKQEASEFLGYPESDVLISGVPQFDIYGQARSEIERIDFIRSLGGDPNKKILTYATGTRELVDQDTEPEIVQLIHAAIEDGKIPNSQLIVRLHPRRIEGFKGEKHLFLQSPGSLSQDRRASGYYWTSGVEDYKRWANTLAHTDVLINVASTVTIESCIFNTPVVNVAFDGKTSKEYLKSVRRHFDYSHYRPLLQEGGVRIAWTDHELFDIINRYLENPSLDQAGRQRIVKNQCFQVDGLARKRLLDYVIQFVESQP